MTDDEIRAQEPKVMNYGAIEFPGGKIRAWVEMNTAPGWALFYAPAPWEPHDMDLFAVPLTDDGKPFDVMLNSWEHVPEWYVFKNTELNPLMDELE